MKLHKINNHQGFISNYRKEKNPLPLFSRNNHLKRNNKFIYGYFTTARKYLEKCLEASSLHGLKYIGDASLSYGERLIWLLAFIFAILMAIYFILQIYEKYDKSPVIITLNPIPVTPHDMPFPSVTICNLNKALLNEAENVIFNGSITDNSFLDDTCDFSDAISYKSFDRKTEKYDNYFRFLTKVSPSCKEVLKVCKWREKEIDCINTFQEVITDDGICCTFNQLPPIYIFKNNTRHETTHPMNMDKVSDEWDPELGYSPTSKLDAFPYRCVGAGSHLGLTLVLDTMIDKYFCSSLNSAGFKVILHTPIDIPNAAEFSFLISPGQDTRVAFRPILNDAVFDIRSIDIGKRNCYFNDERYLRYYRTYTEINCKMECIANRTISQCKCVPYYLPAHARAKTCGKLQDKCVDEVKQQMETSGTNEFGDRWCNCLVGCFNIEYEKEISASKMTGNFRIQDDIIKNISSQYFTKNMAVIQLFFTARNFRRFTKNRLYGFSELLSNTGGLLGLFLGLSVLSVVEVCYYFSIRLFCMYARSRNGKNTTKTVHFTE